MMVDGCPVVCCHWQPADLHYHDGSESNGVDGKPIMGMSESYGGGRGFMDWGGLVTGVGYVMAAVTWMT